MPERCAVIEVSAKRLGLTSILDERENPGYHAPSLEEDMQEINSLVWGSVTPAQQEVVRC